MQPKKTKCAGCGFPITWMEKRQQYARAIKFGLTPLEASRLMPRCYRCLSAVFRSQTPAAPAKTSPSP
jgi:hypothetical protein